MPQQQHIRFQLLHILISYLLLIDSPFHLSRSCGTVAVSNYSFNVYFLDE